MDTVSDSPSSSSDYSSIIGPAFNIDIHDDSPIKIDNIQEEDTLIAYTNNHYTNKFYEDLRKIHSNVNVYNNDDSMYSFQKMYVRSNSPINASNPGSNENSVHGSNSSEHSILKPSMLQHDYYELEQALDKYYDKISDNKLSSEIDILITYVKGQKHLFTHSKNIIQWKLNLLMFPALMLTAAVTIIAPFIECQPWGGGTISAINATIAFLISLMNYLKYESTIESYLQMANQFDRLETSLDLTNSKLLFLENEYDKQTLVVNKIKEFEKKLNEIKEFNKTLIPEEIKVLFPIISHIQIFSFIKKIENYKKTLLAKYKDVNNEIKYIIKKWKLKPTNDNDMEKIKENNRLLYLYDIKNTIKDEILSYRNAYSHIDEVFSKEIAYAEASRGWFQKKKVVEINPNINKYINFIAID